MIPGERNRIAVDAGHVEENLSAIGGRGHLVEPLDVEGWREAMRRVIEDDAWHASLCAGGIETAARFTWERCAADTLAAYRAAGGQGRRAA